MVCTHTHSHMSNMCVAYSQFLCSQLYACVLYCTFYRAAVNLIFSWHNCTFALFQAHLFSCCCILCFHMCIFIINERRRKKPKRIRCNMHSKTVILNQFKSDCKWMISLAIKNTPIAIYNHRWMYFRGCFAYVFINSYKCSHGSRFDFDFRLVFFFLSCYPKIALKMTWYLCNPHE